MKSKLRPITVSAILSAIGFVLMFFNFPIPIMPSFVKLDFSDFPALIGAFALGPVYGAAICLIKNILHFILDNSGTGGVGEFSNFILSASFAVSAGLIYRLTHNKRGAVIGALFGALIMGFISIYSNMFIVYPFYYNMLPKEAILGMYQAILPGIESVEESLVVFNAPFTVVKGLICAVITILIYKPISPLLKGRR
ncbi:MAG: ECF transporter S component [Oscillospiraceae bacterium]|nr:ECF transporter S component [Oscillospiraceae bacterium]